MKTKVSLRFTIDVESDETFSPDTPYAEIVDRLSRRAEEIINRAVVPWKARDCQATKVSIDWEKP